MLNYNRYSLPSQSMLYTANGPVQPTDLIELRRYSYKLATATVNGYRVEGLLFQDAPLPIMLNEIEDLGYLYSVIYQ